MSVLCCLLCECRVARGADIGSSARRNGPNPAVQQREAERRATGRNPPLGGAPPANE